jgi:protein-disulfide isomerase
MRSQILVIPILGLCLGVCLGPLACAGEPAGAHSAGARHAPAVPQVRHQIGLAADDHALGGAEPLVTIVVFSDYACPPCGRAWQVFDHLLEDYGDDIRVVFRSLTVPGFADGERAAEAAFAAGAQGQFWPMHRRLFAENPPRFDRATLKAHAEAIGLDVPRFLDDLDLGAFSARRIQHRREAVTLGVFFGPVALVNGRPVIGFRDEPSWHDLIDEEILTARAKLREGVARGALHAAFQAEAVSAPLELEGEAAAASKQLETRFAADLKKLPADFQRVVPGQRYQVPAGDAPATGPVDAPVQLVAFMDFECPFCRRAAQDGFTALRQRFPDDVRVVFRHLPLPAHRAADGAARAAVAADLQGQFWPFTERLLAADTTRLDRATFIATARAVGLDEARFLADLDGPAAAATVREDMLLARQLGAAATPSFFLNGRFVDGFRDVDALVAEVAAELATADELIKTGTPRAAAAAALLARGLAPDQFPNASSQPSTGQTSPRPSGPPPTEPSGPRSEQAPPPAERDKP